MTTSGPRGAGVGDDHTSEAGSQRQRTTLAWNRTAVALLGTSVLMVARHDRAFPVPVAVGLALLTVLTALATVGLAVRRGRLDLAHEGTRPATPAVVSVGVALTVLCAATGVALALTAR